MSILSDMMAREQLRIKDCFEIDMAGWTRMFPRSTVILMQENVYEMLELRYGNENFIDEDFFPTIYNDIPELMFSYLHGMGYITGASYDSLLDRTRRGRPYWGVPEVPQFMVDIITYPNDTSSVQVQVSNLIWENSWKSIDPYIYHKFIEYMGIHWKSNLQFHYNPNPWEILNDIIANPNKYAQYGYTM